MTRILLAEWTWKAPELPFDSWWFLGVVLLLLVCLIWVIARLTTTVTDDIDPAEIDRQMLTAVNELHSQGELSEEEYRSIKGRLVTRLSNKPPPSDSEGSAQEAQAEQEIEGPQQPATDNPKTTHGTETNETCSDSMCTQSDNTD
jgi:hypothetical protein